MTVLNRLYASGGPEVLIPTLEIYAGGETYWLTQGFEDVTATLENGQQVTFMARGIDIALPARNADGMQDLKFAICNIDGSVSKSIKQMLEMDSGGSLILRSYLSTDLSAPAEQIVLFTIKSGSWTPTVAQITAGYLNVLDKAWPRHRYTLPEYPGLRYA